MCFTISRSSFHRRITSLVSALALAASLLGWSQDGVGQPRSARLDTAHMQADARVNAARSKPLNRKSLRDVPRWISTPDASVAARAFSAGRSLEASLNPVAASPGSLPQPESIGMFEGAYRTSDIDVAKSQSEGASDLGREGSSRVRGYIVESGSRGNEISLCKVRDMFFGNAVVGSKGGTIVLQPDGKSNTTGHVVLIPDDSEHPAVFSYTFKNSGSCESRSFGLALPRKTQLIRVGGKECMTVDRFESSIGESTIAIGATLSINGNQRPGTYAGAFYVMIVND